MQQKYGSCFFLSQPVFIDELRPLVLRLINEECLLIHIILLFCYGCVPFPLLLTLLGLFILFFFLGVVNLLFDGSFLSSAFYRARLVDGNCLTFFLIMKFFFLSQ